MLKFNPSLLKWSRNGLGAILLVGVIGCQSESQVDEEARVQNSSRRDGVSGQARNDGSPATRTPRRARNPDAKRYQSELARRTAALGGPEAFPYLTDPFDPKAFEEELEAYRNELKEGKTLPWERRRVIRGGIERLTVDENREFDAELQDPLLRSQEALLPYLLAYDFQAGGQTAALGQLHEMLIKDRGGDSDSLAALALVDDWEKTSVAMYSPGMSYDGAGGEALALFMTIRAALYPENYEKFKDVVAFPNR